MKTCWEVEVWLHTLKGFIYKFSLCLTKYHAMKTCWEVEVWLHTFLTLETSGQLHA